MLDSPLWKDQYSIGIEEIDLQHQYFLYLISKIEHYARDGFKNLTAYNVFQEISSYARFHFRSEENLMIEYGYPKIEQQFHEHKQLIDKLLFEIGSFEEDNKEDLSKIHDFLVEWFIEHTTRDDKEMGEFLKQKMNPKSEIHHQL